MIACFSSSATYSAFSSLAYGGNIASARSRHVAMRPRKLLLPARSPSWRSILIKSVLYSSGSGSPSSNRYVGRLTSHRRAGSGSRSA
ncbi:MAG: hypothetical protein DMD81_11765 [Candidatus Rokuibacteriota bacterium]|nr:MAG: hypothetical protein DMD81_11765 [Candidatus Rokubacteria bacterium]